MVYKQGIGQPYDTMDDNEILTEYRVPTLHQFKKERLQSVIDGSEKLGFSVDDRERQGNQPSRDGDCQTGHPGGDPGLDVDCYEVPVKPSIARLLPLFRSKPCDEARLLQSTLENIDEGLSVFDSRGRLMALNSRFRELLEFPLDLKVGASLRDILMLQAVRGDFGEGDPLAEVARRLERFYRDVPIKKERTTPRGRILQIRRRAMPDGAVVSVYADITELKASERKLIQARSLAETANRAKGEFLANMSHELRTPLNAIIGFSEIIAHELFGPMCNDRYLDYMKDIHKSSLHLLSIINDVLDMSKIEAGKLELSKEPLNLRKVIGEVVRMMRERAESRRVKLVAQLPEQEVEVWADERAMRQICLNLLSNAIKFSREGGEVRIRILTDQPQSAAVEFEDRGVGMSAEELERALQPFGQAKPSTTRNYGGTGLGLPITKGLIEAHGGRLTIESHAGQGTIARISLPIEGRQLPASA
jgi:signal transduction histidine kinase